MFLERTFFVPSKKWISHSYCDMNRCFGTSPASSYLIIQHVWPNVKYMLCIHRLHVCGHSYSLEELPK